MLTESKYKDLIQTVLDFYADSKYSDILSNLDFLDSRLSMIGTENLMKMNKDEFMDLIKVMVEDGYYAHTANLVEKIYDAGLLVQFLRPQYQEFSLELDKYFHQYKEVEITVPVALDDPKKQRIKNLMAEVLGDFVRVVYVIDNKIVAGCLIKYNNKEYDYSFINNGMREVTSVINNII